MKKTTLTLMIASGSLGAVFYFSPTNESTLTEINSIQSANTVQVESQKDTEIDVSSTKDAMEYFMSGIAETDLKSMENKVAHFSEHQGNGIIDKALFAKYLAYKSALEDIDLSSNMTDLSLLNLQEIHQALFALQERFFSKEEQQLLFEHDNRMRELALQKLQLKENSIDRDDYQQKLQNELELQPDYVQKSHKNQVLLTQLSQANSLNSQDKYLNRAELVGEEAAQRLDVLDRQRERFSETIDAYISLRNDIFNDVTLSRDEQLASISELRSNTFPPEQLKRIQAIERINDNGKSP